MATNATMCNMNNNGNLTCDCGNEEGWRDEITGLISCDNCTDAAYERWCENGENWFPAKPTVNLPDNRWH